MSNTDGPQDAAGPDDCVEAPRSDEDRDSFSVRDEFVEAFGTPRPTYAGGQYATRTDDLPEQLDDQDVADAHAPPFLLDRNQICHADRSVFVARDERGRIVARFEPDQVTRDPDGRYRTEVAGWSSANQSLQRQMLVVEPLRPTCKHLVRQLDPPKPSELAAGVVKKGWMRRYCAARRSTAGAFLDLTDQEMAACSLREPYDDDSARKLDDFDDSLHKRSQSREHLPMFNLTKKFLEPLEEKEKSEG